MIQNIIVVVFVVIVIGAMGLAWWLENGKADEVKTEDIQADSQNITETKKK